MIPSVNPFAVYLPPPSSSPRPPSLTALLHSRSVYALVPELAAHLPPEAPPEAHPCTPMGLHGQQARATVYIEEVILPQAEEGLHERPKTALYHVSYRCLANVSNCACPKTALYHVPYMCLATVWVCMAQDSSLSRVLQVPRHCLFKCARPAHLQKTSVSLYVPSLRSLHEPSW